MVGPGRKQPGPIETLGKRISDFWCFVTVMPIGLEVGGGGRLERKD